MKPSKPAFQEFDPDPRVAFGKRLRALRAARGISQEALADLSGIDRAYVGSIERGQRNVSILNIYRLARALEVEPLELLRQPAGAY
jgi:transcriptional regulator with XRE-family HTH domain